MDDRDVARCWDGNADTWTRLARAGYDIYRDSLNTPAFLRDAAGRGGLAGLDIGCGEGHNTRLLADRGAATALDISRAFLGHALTRRPMRPRDIGTSSPVPSICRSQRRLDFATGFMSFMDVPEIDRVLAEAFRVLRPGGFLQFSIAHPCFGRPHRRNLRDAQGGPTRSRSAATSRGSRGRSANGSFSAAPPELRAGVRPFRIPRFTRPLSEWINLLLDTGLQDRALRGADAKRRDCPRYPTLQDAQVVAYFLHLRVRKPHDR